MILRTKAVFFILILTACAEENNAKMLKPLMNKSSEKNYVIASPLDGVLIEKGEPASNVKITRILTWNANEQGLIQHFTTDADGKFSLPLHEDSFKMSSLTQFTANQTLLLNYGEVTEDPIWISGHLTGELYGETGGSRIEFVTCDTYNELRPVYGNGITLLSTKCRWEGIQLEEENE